jgi:hypothetical protein
LLNHALFSEVEYNKTIPICELDCVWIIFKNSKDFEPRINIRQKLSDQFALKLEGEFKINRLLK